MPVTAVSSNESQGRVTSTITFSTSQGTEMPKPNSMVYLKLSESSLSPFVGDKGTESNPTSANLTPPVVTRRNSVGRESHRENRAFVVTSSDSFEAAEDDYPKEGNLPEQNSNANPLGGSYFFAATDHTGKPIALHVEKGSSFQGDKLQVVEPARTKARSHSLPAVEMEDFQKRFHFKEGSKCKTEATIAMNQNSDPKFQLGSEMAAVHLDLNANTSKVIPPFMLSTPRTSDSLSTSNVLTDAESGSRQPVAIHRPGIKESTSILSKALETHVHNQHQQSHFKSTTFGSTLLESKPQPEFSVDQEVKTVVKTKSDAEATLSVTTNDTTPTTISSIIIPSKHNYQEVTSSFALYPNEKGEIAMVDSHKDSVDILHDQELPSRRISYLMATQSGSATKAPNLLGPKLWSSAKKPHLAAALSSTLFQPVMVQTPQGDDMPQSSTGNNSGEEPMECMEEDEVSNKTV